MAKILIVEDDASIASLYKTELELNKHVVKVLGTGVNAVKEANDFGPDLILLDIQLPDKGGVEILKDLRNNTATKSTKIAMLTNYATDTNIDASLEAGADDFIPKYKIVPEELTQKVAELIS